MLDWQEYETILMDMDGTVLDLAFDNYFWRELVPRHLARVHGLDRETARSDLFQHYANKQGSLDWYCLDYWSAQLQLDLKALKSASSHRIQYLPGARKFLATVSAEHKQIVLVTNAHGHSLQVKKGVAGLGQYFHDCISAHQLGYAKEHKEFWPLLQASIHFDPDTTLFIDDSLHVLDAARNFGIRGIVAVTRPDTRLPVRESGTNIGVEGVSHLLAKLETTVPG